MSSVEENVQSQLFELQDLKYREFQCKLMPTVKPETVIGVRTPELRKLARKLNKTPEALEFLKILPHTYYAAVEAFLPYIDNWATCDLISPKVFKKHLSELYEKIKVWLKSGQTYTVRFGIEMLMSFYLGDNFRPEMLELVACVRSEGYYVNMMIAWYFSMALVKQYDATLPYILKQRLEKWTHNKAIQKAIESYRIGDEAKAYLRMLKVK